MCVLHTYTELERELEREREKLTVSTLCLSAPAGLHSSYAGHAGQIDSELRVALSPDCHMTPVFDERTFHSPAYHSPSHEAQGSLYRTNPGTAAATSCFIETSVVIMRNKYQ